MSVVEGFANVLSPCIVGPVRIKNRVVRAAHGTATLSDGAITDAFIDFHAARARGGVGLTILENGGVHRTAPFAIDLTSDRVIDGYQRLVSAIDPYDMRLFQQLWHTGSQNEVPGRTAPWAASEIPGAQSGLSPRSMSRRDIGELVDGFASAAARCKAGGLDGVEVHAAHGYLLAQFLSPLTNLRSDEYGGDRRNRLRIVVQIVEAIRDRVGSEFAVGVRLSAEPTVPGGISTEEGGELAELLTQSAQLDFLDFSTGTYYVIDKIFPGSHEKHAFGLEPNAAALARVKIPRIVTGRFLTLEEADAAIASGQTDMVSMVRALIADPMLVMKAQDGSLGAIRPCTGNNQGCIGGALTGRRRRIECVTNVGAGNEGYLGDEHLPRSTHTKRVVIVGGGPAGLEAARVAASVGHKVVLLESAGELGGQVRFTRAAPLRREFAGPIAYWESEIVRLGVNVHLNRQVGSNELASLGRDFDAAVIATGSIPRRDAFQSTRPWQHDTSDSRPVLTSWDVLSGTPVGEHAVVADDWGHYEAIDVAEYLLDRGHAVDFVTRFPTIGYRLEGDAKGWEILGAPHLRYLLGNPRFTLHPRSYIATRSPDTVTAASLDAEGRSRIIDATSLVFVSNNLSSRALADAAAFVFNDLRVVGDAAGPRLLRLAVIEGHLAALSLDKATMPAALPPGSGAGHLPYLA